MSDKKPTHWHCPKCGYPGNQLGLRQKRYWCESCGKEVHRYTVYENAWVTITEPCANERKDETT